MQRLIITTTFICCFLTAITAQTLIKGRVTGADQKPVELVNITLHKAADSALVKGALSDPGGYFELEGVSAGSYFLRASYLGFEPGTWAAFTVSGQNPVYDAGALTLREQAATLDQVTVRAQKPFIERKLDKLIVNVENSIVSAGASAMEVLERSPGVIVDQDGNISLKGRQGVIIMMDDKPVQLSGADLANLLRSTSSSSIETIEIIANPSAKYDAEGSAGIINLKTKRDKRLGANGSITLSAGHGKFGKANGSANLNYRDKKWNLFATYSYNWTKFFNHLEVKRYFRENGEVQAIYDHDNFIVYPFNNQTPRVGVDFFPDKKTTIGVLMTGVDSWYNPYADNSARILDPAGNQTGSFNTTNDSRDIFRNYAVNLNVRHQLDTAGRVISADLDYANYTIRTKQLFNTRFLDLENNLTGEDYLRGDISGLLNLYSAKADYEHPMGKAGKLDAGVKSSLVKTDNNLKYFIRENGEEVPDDRQSNHFLYEEHINAAYLNWSKEWGKWNLQLGLRGEQTRADGRQVTTDSAFHRNYFQVFPSAFLNVNLNQNHVVGINLSRRINRPDYQQLNPFRAYVDPTTFREGNPFLRPQLTWSAELSHTFKQRFSTTLSYSITYDNMTQVLLQNNEARYTVVTFINLARYEYFGLGFSAPFDLMKWWNVNASGMAYWNRYLGEVAGYGLNEAGPAFNVNINNTFRLPGNWSAELGGYYTHRQVFSISVIEPMWSLNAGIQKTFWDGKGTLRFNMRDIFWHGWPRGSTQFGNIDESFRSYRETRVGTLAFTWRFGKKTVQAARRRTMGAEEEMQRARNG